MENRYFIKKCFLLPSDPVGSLKETFILDLGNPSITYVESLKSPSISMTITFLDVDGVVSREGLTAGESIDLSIKVPGFPDFEIKPDKHNMVLNGISDVTTFANKQEATLEFVSVESIINGETDVPTLVSHSIFPLKSRKRVCPENDDISRPLFVITGLPPKSVIKEELPPIDAELKDLVQKFLPSLKSVA